MKTLATIFCAVLFATCACAQSLSSNNKTVAVSELPEYIAIYCDNTPSGMNNTLRTFIHAKDSEFEDALKNLQSLLEDIKYLKISNPTDLLNAMLKLGFEYVDAYAQNPSSETTPDRTCFVFRKKEIHRK